MYERMLDKKAEPSLKEIEDYLGSTEWKLLQMMEERLEQAYELKRELKFPFGNNYGWGYKYSHKTKHLCYVFFEKGAIMLQLQLGGNVVSKVEEVLSECQPQTKKAWENKYPCGDGGWIYERIFSKEELDDVLRLIAIKQSPKFLKTK